MRALCVHDGEQTQWYDLYRRYVLIGTLRELDAPNVTNRRPCERSDATIRGPTRVPERKSC
jgi:hypothetical protein